MAMVRVTATEADELSEESLAQLAALEDRPIDYSDIPALTPDEFQRALRRLREKHQKRMFSLRLQTATIEKWQAMGEGYTGVMARLLEEAWKHPEWIRQCIEDPPLAHEAG